ncbi:MAG: proton-conducting transporter membrane subunit [Anaerolineae bacterium]
MVWWLAGTLVLPLIGACISGLLGRRNDHLRRWTPLVASALTTLCVLSLLAYGDRHIRLGVEWLPGYGAWSLHVGGVGLWAAVTTTASAFMVYVIARGAENARSPFMDVFTLVALSASNVAFLMGHFLGRYVALEIVALCVAAVLAVESTDRQATSSAGRVYLVLRVGDAGLLAAILILLDAAGSLDIETALGVGAALDGPIRAWTAAGFALACWVKLGVWPFHQWLAGGRALPLPVRGWVFATVMPQLGLYLLYRVSPIITGGMVGVIVLVLGSVSVVLGAMLGVLHLREDPGSIVVYGSAVVGGAAIALAAVGAQAALVVLLVLAAPVRALAWWAGSLVPAEAVAVARAPNRLLERLLCGARAALRFGETSVFQAGIIRIAQAMLHFAKILHRLIEVEVFQEGVMQVARATLRLANHDLAGLADHDQVMRVARATLRLANVLHWRVEDRGLDHLPATVSGSALRGAWWFSHQHSGRLRDSLLWVVLSPIVALLLVVVVG